MSEILEEEQDEQAWQRADEQVLQEEIVSTLHRLDCGLGNHKDVVFLAELLDVRSLFETV